MFTSIVGCMQPSGLGLGITGQQRVINIMLWVEDNSKD